MRWKTVGDGIDSMLLSLLKIVFLFSLIDLSWINIIYLFIFFQSDASLNLLWLIKVQVSERSQSISHRTRYLLTFYCSWLWRQLLNPYLNSCKYTPCQPWHYDQLPNWIELYSIDPWIEFKLLQYKLRGKTHKYINEQLESWKCSGERSMNEISSYH